MTTIQEFLDSLTCKYKTKSYYKNLFKMINKVVNGISKVPDDLTFLNISNFRDAIQFSKDYLKQYYMILLVRRYLKLCPGNEELLSYIQKTLLHIKELKRKMKKKEYEKLPPINEVDVTDILYLIWERIDFEVKDDKMINTVRDYLMWSMCKTHGIKYITKTRVGVMDDYDTENDWFIQTKSGYVYYKNDYLTPDDYEIDIIQIKNINMTKCLDYLYMTVSKRDNTTTPFVTRYVRPSILNISIRLFVRRELGKSVPPNYLAPPEVKKEETK